MTIVVANLEIRLLTPNLARNATYQQKLPPVRLGIKLVSFSPLTLIWCSTLRQKRLLLLRLWSSSFAGCRAPTFPLHLLPL